ncbi:MAG: cellulase family glycosylhydrolase [Spirochaetes bacterium]|nr:cellulase family glycosylhydrolase [Spirochaetota bacterium]
MLRNLTLSAMILAMALGAEEAQGWGVLAPNPAGIKKGDTVFSADFESEAGRKAWGEAPFAKWVKEGVGGGMCLKVSVPADATPGHHKLNLPIDLSRYKGMKVLCTAKVRAVGATKAPQAYNGVKWMLHYKSAASENYVNQNDVYGTFDWKELSFTTVLFADLLTADLSLGLEMSTGEVWFDDLKITVISQSLPVRPAPKANAPAPDRGHDLSRLRGAMLHPSSLGDADYRVFAGEWKGNLARCQMTRAWGKAGTDLDLVEYDHWIDETCVEIDRMLNAALTYGFKVAIDLHSPPGGRLDDRSMRMFYEKKYQDHFVAVWEKLAKRYKGHPAVWGFDLINEPVETKPTEPGMGYLETQARAARAIRAIDPKTPIIVESAEWDSPAAFAYLEPIDVPRVIYQAHMYEPGEYTHQGVHNTTTGIAYPGEIRGKKWDKEALRKVLAPVREFQRAYNVPIYLGEFSAVRWAPGASRYLSDVIEIFEEYGWDWSYHAFREWSGWSVEFADEPVDKNKHIPAATTARKEVLLSWFAKNEKPKYPDRAKWMRAVPEKAPKEAAPAVKAAEASQAPAAALPAGVFFQESFAGGEAKSFPAKTYTLEAGPAGKALCIALEEAGKVKNTTAILPVEAMRGKKVTLKARAKGEAISVPPKTYNGPKFMMVITKDDGKKDYPQAALKTGSWDWQDAAFTVDIPANATKLELTLGLELSTGKIWFDEIRVAEAGK